MSTAAAAEPLIMRRVTCAIGSVLPRRVEFAFNTAFYLRICHPACLQPKAASRCDRDREGPHGDANSRAVDCTYFG